MTERGFKATVAVLLAIALLLSGIGLYVAEQPHGGSATYPTQTVWNNATVEHNSTIYRNVTENVTKAYWHNSTSWVNTTVNTTHVIYRNSTEYVNTTIVELVPVVNVTYVWVNYSAAALGQNFTVTTHENYSLPIGTVTWLQFNVATYHVKCSCWDGFNVSVNSPWTLLLYTSWVYPEDSVAVTALIGVPYWPGTYSLDVTVGYGSG
jgi:hypothetical protein